MNLTPLNALTVSLTPLRALVPAFGAAPRHISIAVHQVGDSKAFVSIVLAQGQEGSTAAFLRIEHLDREGYFTESIDLPDPLLDVLDQAELHTALAGLQVESGTLIGFYGRTRS